MKTFILFVLALLPRIFPDYSEVTIPKNIAPLDFSIIEPDASAFKASLSSGTESYMIKSRNGDIEIPERKWNTLVREGNGTITVSTSARINGEWREFKPFNIYVSDDKIDSYIAYRLIPPGYEVWGRMGIYQRCLETYEQSPIAENSLTEDNCMNCHSFSNRRPDRMMLHMRAKHGGTYILKDNGIEKVNTKTPETIAAGVYPNWSNDGKYIAFSVNDIAQFFHSTDPNRVEVFDYESDVVVYDVERHELLYSDLTKSPEWFETMPCFSPDGRYLLFTHQSYGQFPIWHKDADLYLIDLDNGSVSTLGALNSKDVDSYHSWSSNGRWVVFSSRRDDGLYTKPYIAHIDAEGNASKPFLLPQRNPREFYLRLMDSFNIPEFITDKVKAGPKDFAKSALEDEAAVVTARPQ